MHLFTYYNILLCFCYITWTIQFISLVITALINHGAAEKTKLMHFWKWMAFLYGWQIDGINIRKWCDTVNNVVCFNFFIFSLILYVGKKTNKKSASISIVFFCFILFLLASYSLKKLFIVNMFWIFIVLVHMTVPVSSDFSVCFRHSRIVIWILLGSYLGHKNK